MRGLRDEHLAAMPRSADPGGPVDVEAYVAALGRGRLAGVDAHPDAERGLGRPVVAGECALCVGGGTDGVARAAERDEELVAAAIDLVAARLPDRLPDQAAVIGHHPE